MVWGNGEQAPASDKQCIRLAQCTLLEKASNDESFEQLSLKLMEERFAALPPEQRQMIASKQANIRVQSYRKQWPNALWYQVVSNDQCIGLIVVDSNKQTIHIVDLFVLPEWRGNAIASDILQAFINESITKQQTCELTVAINNPAVSLYQRLLFVEVSRTQTDSLMRYQRV